MEFCRRHKADLAILENNKNAIKFMAESIKQLPNTCINFWIGISKFSYTETNGKCCTQHGDILIRNRYDVALVAA